MKKQGVPQSVKGEGTKVGQGGGGGGKGRGRAGRRRAGVKPKGTSECGEGGDKGGSGRGGTSSLLSAGLKLKIYSLCIEQSFLFAPAGHMAAVDLYLAGCSMVQS